MAYEEGRQDTDLASQFREVMAGVPHRCQS
jgi:hypothetical protein